MRSATALRGRRSFNLMEIRMPMSSIEASKRGKGAAKPTKAPKVGTPAKPAKKSKKKK
jgi:hypothetical protein